MYHGDLIRWRMAEQPLSLLLPLSSPPPSLFLPQFQDDESQFEYNLNSRGAAIFLVRVRYCFRVRFLTALSRNANAS